MEQFKDDSNLVLHHKKGLISSGFAIRDTKSKAIEKATQKAFRKVMKEVAGKVETQLTFEVGELDLQPLLPGISNKIKGFHPVSNDKKYFKIKRKEYNQDSGNCWVVIDVSKKNIIKIVQDISLEIINSRIDSRVGTGISSLDDSEKQELFQRISKIK